jgi:hypothetical protein
MSRDDDTCPACGFALEFKPWDDTMPSFEICPSCGIQFGYDDVAGGASDVAVSYLEWRQKWVRNGMRWWSSRRPPENWDPEEQLRQLVQKTSS